MLGDSRISGRFWAFGEFSGDRIYGRIDVEALADRLGVSSLGSSQGVGKLAVERADLGLGERVRTVRACHFTHPPTMNPTVMITQDNNKMMVS